MLENLVFNAIDLYDVRVSRVAYLALTFSKDVVLLENGQFLNFGLRIKPICEAFEVDVSSGTFALASLYHRVFVSIGLLKTNAAAVGFRDGLALRDDRGLCHVV